MSNLATKVQLYLKANSKSFDTELRLGNVSVVDDGTGAVIKVWNVEGLKKPTNKE